MIETERGPSAAAAPPAGEPDPAETARTAERLFVAYAPRIYRLARHLLGNDADAEDATQDVFVQVLRKLPAFRAEAALPTWLYRVAVNAALNCRRRRTARARHQVRGDPTAFAADARHLASVQHWPKRPLDRALDHETHQLIARAIARLPEEYRAVYVLADVEELSCPQIAEILGLSTATVKSRLHRARACMRRTLAPYFGEVMA
jgi:RNA polymerase sigma-70 factor (ECF subfamily)